MTKAMPAHVRTFFKFPVTSLLGRTNSCRRHWPQHSPLPIADQWQSTPRATIASRESQPSTTTPILDRKPLLFLVRRAGFRADGPRGRRTRSTLDGEVTVAEVTSGDFCIAVYREDDVWEAEVLPAAVIGSLESIIHALRQQPSIGGVVGLTAVGDDFFVITRVTGTHTAVFLSHLTASVDWPLERQVLEDQGNPLTLAKELVPHHTHGDTSLTAHTGA